MFVSLCLAFTRSRLNLGFYDSRFPRSIPQNLRKIPVSSSSSSSEHAQRGENRVNRRRQIGAADAPFSSEKGGEQSSIHNYGP